MNARARALARVTLVTALSVAALLLLGAAVDAGARPAPAHPGAAKCARPYRASSPWNRPIGARPRYQAASAAHVAAIDGPLTSDPTQYTYPVYYVNRHTRRVRVALDGYFSDVRSGGRRLHTRHGGTVRLPIPRGAAAAAGTDAQIILLNRATGDEWGAWQFRRDGGGWRIENGYHYNARWSGVPPHRFGSRGAGVTYLAGLVRPCEIARGRIDHALAFAYDFPTGRHVYPATKSDGSSSDPADLPEGARLQLDPSLTKRRLARLGCRGACLTIARALQRYGMYVIDKSGHPKIMLEYEKTAHWRGRLSARTVSPIPLESFRVLAYGR